MNHVIKIVEKLLKRLFIISKSHCNSLFKCLFWLVAIVKLLDKVVCLSFCFKFGCNLTQSQLRCWHFWTVRVGEHTLNYTLLKGWSIFLFWWCFLKLAFPFVEILLKFLVFLNVLFAYFYTFDLILLIRKFALLFAVAICRLEWI